MNCHLMKRVAHYMWTNKLPNAHVIKGVSSHLRFKFFSIPLKTGLFPCPRQGMMLPNQGWEFAHLTYKQIARFLSKNERMSDSLIPSFLVSDLSDSLTIAHFL